VVWALFMWLGIVPALFASVSGAVPAVQLVVHGTPWRSDNNALAASLQAGGDQPPPAGDVRSHRARVDSESNALVFARLLDNRKERDTMFEDCLKMEAGGGAREQAAHVLFRSLASPASGYLYCSP
jgi:hypothetical protein